MRRSPETLPIVIRIPLETVSLSNQREHWAKRSRRAKDHRRAAYMWTQRIARVDLPLTVTLTRIAPRKLDDDNLRGALKSVRDGVADRLGIDDNDLRVSWMYGQKAGNVGEKAVEVWVDAA